MLETLRQTIKKFRLVTPNTLVVVGVSGGADSLALLHMLSQLAPRMSFRIHAATLNHQLRGEESDGDVEFVRGICREWGIELTVGAADVTSLARDKQMGIEAAARFARYDFLAQVASKVEADTVAVAHHADDQAETVLMHLLRGAGVGGASGMMLKSTVPMHPDLTLIRPLLSVTRREIEDYCEQVGLKPRYDSTNSDTTILRNQIRLDVLPYLETVSAEVRSALVRFAEIAAVEDDFIHQKLVELVQSDAVKRLDGSIKMKRIVFRSVHPAIQRRLLVWVCEELEGKDSISAQLILEGVEIAINGQQGAIALLGGKLQLRVDYTFVVIERIGAKLIVADLPLVDAGYERIIDAPSDTDIGAYRLIVEQEAFPEGGLGARLAIAEGATIVLRTRQDGDTFAPPGMKGHRQKISRWMVNVKVPQQIRDQIPLIVVNGEVAAFFVNGQWIISESFAVWNTSRRVIYFQFLQNL
ncbi:MAG: tRNA lysidine(34) synthetase TilS [Chloroflexi bacterium]|nr:tRNA lysidine(34) synthetase TilS [Chloroflexota bacterium]